MRYKIFGAPKKFKNRPRPLLWPRTDHAYPQKLNPSRETVPLNIKNVLIHVQEQQRLEKIFQCANTLYLLVIGNISPVLAPYLLQYVYCILSLLV